MHIKRVEEILGKPLATLNDEELATAVVNEEFIGYLTDNTDAVKDVTNYILENNHNSEVQKAFKVIKYQLDVFDVEDLFNNSSDPEALSKDKIESGNRFEKIYASLLVKDPSYTESLQKAAEEVTDILEEIFDINNFPLIGSLLDILYTAQMEWHEKTGCDILETCVERLMKIQDDFSNVLNKAMSEIAEQYPSDEVAQDLLDPTIVKKEEDE